MGYGELLEKTNKENFGSLYQTNNINYTNNDIKLIEEIKKSDKDRLIKESFIEYDDMNQIQYQKNNKVYMSGIGEVIQIM